MATRAMMGMLFVLLCSPAMAGDAPPLPAASPPEAVRAVPAMGELLDKVVKAESKKRKADKPAKQNEFSNMSRKELVDALVTAREQLLMASEGGLTPPSTASTLNTEYTSEEQRLHSELRQAIEEGSSEPQNLTSDGVGFWIEAYSEAVGELEDDLEKLGFDIGQADLGTSNIAANKGQLKELKERWGECDSRYICLKRSLGQISSDAALSSLDLAYWGLRLDRNWGEVSVSMEKAEKEARLK